MITANEIDVAARAGKVWLGAFTKRVARCQCCGNPIEPGAGRKLWIDGHYRGSVCLVCTRGIK